MHGFSYHAHVNAKGIKLQRIFIPKEKQNNKSARSIEERSLW